MKERLFQNVKETLNYEQLDNGLQVYILPKQGFSKTYATFTTRYGSIDNHFQSGEQEVQVPDGIAHFLEHKMFEKEQGDVFHLFSKYGASANAFTSFDRTSYLFSCTDQVEENLTTLLDFVQTPYFTEKTVEKEKGIIAQEINMYDDNSDFRVYFNLLQGMYHHHPVRIYVAGTVNSIQEITADMLTTCYNFFYHPSNMILFIVGALEPQTIMDLVKKNQADKTFPKLDEIERYYPYEPESVHQAVTDIPMAVGINKCLIGFKERNNGLTGKELLKRELVTQIVLDVLLGKSSPLYEKLYNEGLIGEDFGADYSGEFTYGYSVIGGDTTNPDTLIEKLNEGIQGLHQKSITLEQFERSRKKKIGGFLRSLNSLEFFANQFTKYTFNEIDLFDILDTLDEIRLDEVNDRLVHHFDRNQMAVSIIRPQA